MLHAATDLHLERRVNVTVPQAPFRVPANGHFLRVSRLSDNDKDDNKLAVVDIQDRSYQHKYVATRIPHDFECEFFLYTADAYGTSPIHHTLNHMTTGPDIYKIGRM